MKSVKYNFLMNSILTASSLLFPLITFPYVSRVLQADAYGSVSFVQSIMTYFTMVASLGIPTYGIRACAKVRDDRAMLTQTVQELVIINEAVTLICTVIYVGVICFVPRLQSQKALFWIYSPVLLLNATGLNWLYSAVEQYRYITVRSIAFKSISLVLTLLLVKSSDDLNIYVAILAFSTVAPNICNLWNARKIVNLFARPQKLKLGRHIKSVMSFFAVSVAINIYTNLDAIMLGFMCDDTQVGIYHAATRIRSILLTIITSLGTVLLPRLSYCINNKLEFNRLLGKSFQFTLFTSVPLTIFFVSFAKNTILVLSGKSFLDGTPVLQIIMPTLIIAGLSNITGIQILTPMGKENQLCRSVLLGAIVDFLLNMILIRKYQAVGATIATVFAEIFVLAYQVVCVKNVLVSIRDKIAFKEPLVVSLFSVLVAIGVSKMGLIKNEILEISIVAMVYGAVYMLLMVCRKNEIALLCLDYFLRVIKSAPINTQRKR